MELFIFLYFDSLTPYLPYLEPYKNLKNTTFSQNEIKVL